MIEKKFQEMLEQKSADDFRRNNPEITIIKCSSNCRVKKETGYRRIRFRYQEVGEVSVRGNSVIVLSEPCEALLVRSVQTEPECSGVSGR